ncbi:MAG: Ig-like domain-containing protein [Ruminococcus sp.]|nr:Ig-like domain-containing protein [Ruminococcus sp.]
MKKYCYVKNLLSLVLTFTIFFASFNAAFLSTNAVQATNENQIIAGDVNDDGDVNVKDVTDLQRGLVWIIELSPEQLAVGDVDYNGRTDVRDATLIQKYLVGAVDSLEKPEDQKVLPDSIALDFLNLSIKKGETKKLTAEILPANADDLTVNWYSNDENVATVDNDGNIMAKSVGVAEIIAETVNGKQAFCIVEVLPSYIYATEPANGIVTDTEIKMEDYTLTETSYAVIPSPNPADRFLMVGQQTNFTLLKSVMANNRIGGVVAGPNIYSDHTYNTLKDDYIIDGYNIWIPDLASSAQLFPTDSQFPLVFTQPIKIDSNENRCIYKAYNEGIYFMGCYPDSSEKGQLKDYNYRDMGGGNYHLITQPDGYVARDVSYFTNNDVYGTVLHCKLLVIANDMVSKTAYGRKSMEVYNYSSESGDLANGVVIYTPKDVYLRNYNYDGYVISKKRIPKGYHWVTNGSDLFAENTILYDLSLEMNKNEYLKSVEEINLYGAINSNMHSASENNSSDMFRKVTYLDDRGLFRQDNVFYNSSPNAVRSGIHGDSSRKEYFYDGWKTHSVYCAPNVMPSSGRYDLYCGENFNFMWYSVNDMKISDNLKMYLSSSNTVLTIGPYTDERISKIDSYPYYKSTHSGNSLYSASNLLTAEGLNSAFYICPSPYAKTDYEKDTIRLTVMNNFEVRYIRNGYQYRYTIYKGVYEIPKYYNDEDYYNNQSLIWTDYQGMNLFSDKAMEYFSQFKQIDDPYCNSYYSDGKVTVKESNVTICDTSFKSIFAYEVPCNWVDYFDDSINQSVPVDLSRNDYQKYDYFVDFTVNSGTLNQNYKATSINAKFENNVRFNNATLSARKLSIEAEKLCGDYLFVNTYELNYLASRREYYDEDKRSCFATFKSNEPGATYVYGQIINIKNPYGSEVILCDSLGNPTGQTIKNGTYFIPMTYSINMLDPESWYNALGYYLYKPEGSSEYIKMTKTEV